MIDTPVASDTVKRHLARLRKLHREATRAQIMPELLAAIQRRYFQHRGLGRL